MAAAAGNTAKPLLIAIGGMSGTGKTTLAEALATGNPNIVHIDADRTRKEILGVSETTTLPQEAYGRETTQRMIAEMTRRTKEALAAGKTVIVTSVLLSPRARQDQEQLARDARAPFVGLWLEANPKTEAGLRTLFERVSTRTDNPSDAGVDVVRRQAERYARPSGGGWHIIDATQAKDKVASTAANIILSKIMSAHRPRPGPRR